MTKEQIEKHLEENPVITAETCHGAIASKVVIWKKGRRLGFVKQINAKTKEFKQVFPGGKIVRGLFDELKIKD